MGTVNLGSYNLAHNLYQLRNKLEILNKLEVEHFILNTNIKDLYVVITSTSFKNDSLFSCYFLILTFITSNQPL